ncbi:hypothetical protein GCM10028806_05130 [Spirosoma terrae]|uniref:Uncharacterized protein n=1 Tax=Spirosoma terrae TaxID=1968276 RepID=A0A6L9LCG2_9BACT|nr:hypothetical protein [Spirosoma terrae]NDU98244.1 hypothetical protein [Spirosoma terrae]
MNFRVNYLLLICSFLGGAEVHAQFMNGVPNLLKTPMGHFVYDEGVWPEPRSFRLPVKDSEFYFYRGHIVGTNGTQHYIIDESQPEDSAYFTTSKTEWLQRIKIHQLKPTLWTKWHDTSEGYWGKTEVSEFYKHGFFYTLSIILLILFLWNDIGAGTSKLTLTLFWILVGIRLIILVWSDWISSI